jgi:hypothetical protein
MWSSRSELPSFWRAAMRLCDGIYAAPIASRSCEPARYRSISCRAVTLKGKRVQMTRKEYALLHGLATHVGLVVTHQQLIRDIWGAHAGNVQYLRILVRKLRQKVEADPTQPLLIVSESGVGYRLDQGEPGPSHRPGDISSHTCCA